MPDGQAVGPKDPKNKYFANKVGPEFLSEARNFEKNWLYVVQQRGVWRLWWLIYCQSLGINPNTGGTNENQELRFVGAEAQYTMFRVQICRRLIENRIMMAKDERLSFEGVATNNDVGSLAQVNIATRAIEHLLTEAKLEQVANEALEAMCYYGGAAILTGWDYHRGDDVDVQEPQLDPEGNPVQMPVPDETSPLGFKVQIGPDGQPAIDPETGEPALALETQMQTVQKPSGMPRYDKLYPWQFAIDPYQERGHLACTTKTPVNKHDLAAKFPEQYDAIMAATLDYDLCDDAMFAWGGQQSITNDTVILRQFFHADCAAVPGGRWAGYISPNIPLWGCDEIVPCPLEQGMPVKIMMGPRFWGTAFGYPEASDILSLQTVINEIVSQQVTSIQKRGNPNAYKRFDVQIDQRTWSEGGTLIDLPANAEPPQWDDPPKMDQAAIQTLDWTFQRAEEMLGSNPTALGKPDANITSGAFGVLMVNTAQKYSGRTQEAYDMTATEAANDGLELTKKNAENGFWAEVAGIGDGPYVEIIKQDKLKSLRRVKLKRRSPIMATYLGRSDVFEKTVNIPSKRDRADAIDMLLTGSTESFAERDQSSKLRIRHENELILKFGISPTVTTWDDHALEGPEHRMEYDKLRTQEPPPDGTPERQLYDAACVAFDDHLNQHSLALLTTPPERAIVAGWQPFVTAPPPGAAGAGGAGAKPGQPAQPAAPGGAGGAPKGVAAPPGGPQQPSAPKPPQAPAGLSPQAVPKGNA